MSIGEDRLRGNENSAPNVLVWDLKSRTAELIDLCERLKPLDGRLAALAQTSYEQAFMWAFKAAMTEPRPDPSVGVPRSPDEPPLR